MAFFCVFTIAPTRAYLTTFRKAVELCNRVSNLIGAEVNYGSRMGVIYNKAVIYWTRFEEYSRPATIFLLRKLHDPQFRRLCLIMGAALTLMGMADWIFNSFFLRASQSLHGQLLPGFKTPNPSYKSEIVDYLVVVVFAAILMTTY